MTLRNAQGQRGKYLTLELSSTRNPVEDMCVIVSEFQALIMALATLFSPVYPTARRGGLRGAGGISTDARMAANIDRGFCPVVYLLAADNCLAPKSG